MSLAGGCTVFMIEESIERISQGFIDSLFWLWGGHPLAFTCLLIVISFGVTLARE